MHRRDHGREERMKLTVVEPSSIGEEIGLQPGDDLLEVNGKKVLDAIDYRFREGTEQLLLKVSRGGEVTLYEIEKDEEERIGLEFEEMNILSCGNDCIFCFVDQNPEGLRKELYFRDGDYRLSFMYGNYTTMTNAGPAILQRIIEQRLSPQYISVHVTEEEVRKRLMGLKKDDRILEKIALLHDNGIDMHTQIVLCPGINDGRFLAKTVRDLYRFRARIRSLAIVPVGLTDHRFGLAQLRKVDHDYAADLLDTVDRWRAKFRKEIGRSFVYPSDEFYIVAGRKVPPAREYDGFSQLENGVGMVRSFLLDFRRQAAEFPQHVRTGSRLTLATGELASGMMNETVLPRLRRITGLDVRLEVVPNRLYGRSVTVAGLLSGKCLYSSLEGKEGGDLLLLPPDILNANGLLLDGETIPRIEERLSVPVMVFDGRWDDVFKRLKQVKRNPRRHPLLPSSTTALPSTRHSGV
jgi:putative radical SAM enzyme (TIGR03279 family)